MKKKILKLGDNIRGSNSNWKFTGKTAKNFDTHIKKSVPLKDVRKSLKFRTSLDKKRKNSPLVKVKDAILIRSDILNKREVLAKMSNSIDKFLSN